MKAFQLLLTASIFFSISANASLITLESRWCCGGIPGTLTFTYDDSILDSVDDEGIFIDNSHPQVGSYQNAIVAASYIVTSGANIGKTFSLVPNSSSSIIIRKYPGVVGPASVQINASVYDGSDVVDLFMRVEGLPPLTDDLSELPFTVRADETTLFIGSYVLASNYLYEGNRLFNEVATVPLPATAYMFGSATLGLVGMARRRRR